MGKPNTMRAPPDDIPVLDFYAEAYAHAFIAFHPFVSVANTDPAKCDYGTININRNDIPNNADLLKWIGAVAEKRRDDATLDAKATDATIKASGIATSWHEISQHIGLADHLAMNQALRTSIGGLKKRYSNDIAAHKLVAYCSGESIFLPTEGNFQPIMQGSIAKLMAQAGFGKIILSDEFDEEQKVVDIQLLLTPAPWSDLEAFNDLRVRTIADANGNFLATVHWDSFFTIMACNDLGLAKLIEQSFEGIWCDSQTTIGWLIPATARSNI